MFSEKNQQAIMIVVRGKGQDKTKGASQCWSQAW